MKLLFLGPYNHSIISFLLSFNDEVTYTEAPITNCFEYIKNVDFIISYKYRNIINREIIDRFPNKAINLHISLLPWNRGADPNLWSFLEDTPKGVTIHYIDMGVDTGDILVQQDVVCFLSDTLRTSYDRLTIEIEKLFKSFWPSIRNGKIKAFSQHKGGSYHRSIDRIQFDHLLINGWDTPVKNIIGKAI